MAAMLICGLLTACGSRSGTNEVAAVAEDALQAIPQELTGIWQRRGYGTVYEIANNQTTHYAITSQSCLQSDTVEGFLAVAPEEQSDIRIDSTSNTGLSLTLPGAAFPILLSRLTALPDTCNAPVDASTQATCGASIGKTNTHAYNR